MHAGRQEDRTRVGVMVGSALVYTYYYVRYIMI